MNNTLPESQSKLMELILSWSGEGPCPKRYIFENCKDSESYIDSRIRKLIQKGYIRKAISGFQAPCYVVLRKI